MKKKPKMKKVTMLLPADLLERALESSGEGLSATVRQSLEILNAGVAYERLRGLRGKIKFSIDVKSLRED